MAKVIMLASNVGLWGEELQAPWDALRKAGHDVTLATMQGKTPLPLKWSVDKNFRDPNHNLINVDATIDRIHEILANGEWDNPLKIEDVKMSDYNAIAVIGGFGAPIDLNGNPAVHRMLIEAWMDKKTIGALCYAVGALVLARQPDDYKKSIIHGKTIVAHPHEWDWVWALTYDLEGTTPDNPGTTLQTPGFVYPLRPIVEGGVGETGRVISPPETTRENPCAYYDAPFVTGLSFESSEAFGNLLLQAVNAQQA